MSKTIRIFGYTIRKMKKSDGLLFNPVVHICLQRWLTQSDGTPIFTPQLMSEEEIDWYVKALKDDLDSVGRKARQHWSKHTSIQRIVSDRNSIRGRPRPEGPL